MKKRWTLGLLVAGALAAAVTAVQLARPESKGIFYRVTGGKNDMFLIGSIHVGSREMYPMSSEILNAIDNADVLVFECDTTSIEAQNATARLMTSAIPLSERVSSVCLEQVKKAAEKLGYSMEYLEMLDPWAVTSMMSVATAASEMDSGSSRTATSLGVENMVRKRVENQSTAYLETVEYQLGLLEDFSPELQEYLLMSACQALLEPDGIQGMDQDIEMWPVWWHDGNAQAFADSYRKGLEKEASPLLAREYHQSLLVRRNRHMALKLQQMLEDDENQRYVVVVGLMHLVLPDDSMIAELQAMGYQVEQIK